MNDLESEGEEKDGCMAENVTVYSEGVTGGNDLESTMKMKRQWHCGYLGVSCDQKRHGYYAFLQMA